MRSVQFAPHARRSDGQETAFVRVGRATGRSGVVVTEVIFSAGVVVGTGVAAGIPGVTSGVRVAGDMTAGTAEGKILKVPDTWRIPRAAMMTIIAITAPTRIFGTRP